jgi:GTPase KRas
MMATHLSLPPSLHHRYACDSLTSLLLVIHGVSHDPDGLRGRRYDGLLLALKYLTRERPIDQSRSVPGKTNIVMQLIAARFYDQLPTIEDAYRKQLMVDNKTCLLHILDGYYGPNATDSTLWRDYATNTDGVILVYSITWRHSFDQIIPMLKTVREHRIVPSSLAVVLVANKCDLDAKGLRVVSTQEGQELAQSIGASFFETSAKERIHIEDVFFEVVRTTRALQSLHETTTKSKSPKKCVVT